MEMGMVAMHFSPVLLIRGYSLGVVANVALVQCFYILGVTMFTKIREIVCLMVLVVFAVSVYGREKSVSAQENFLPSEVRHALEQNVRDLSPVTVSWKRVRTTEMDLQEMLRAIGEVYNWGFLSDHNVVFMWQDGSFYSCGTGMHALKIIPDERNLPFAFDKSLELVDSYSEVSYNGREYMGGGGNKETEIVAPGMWVYPTDQARQVFAEANICESGFFYFCGYKFTSSGEELQQPQSSLILFYADKSGLRNVQTEMVGNLNTLKVELIGAVNADVKKDRHLVFWLLPDLNYAVKSYQVKSLDGKLVRSIDNDDFMQLPGKKIYLPKISTVTYYSYVLIADKTFDEPLFEEKYHLLDVSSQRIDTAQFDLRQKYTQPGTMIVDHGLSDKGSIQYLIPANPADLDRVIEAAQSGEAFVPTPLPSTAAMIVRWGLMIIGLALVAYALRGLVIRK